MKKHFTDDQIVEITSVVGLFSFIFFLFIAIAILEDSGYLSRTVVLLTGYFELLAFPDEFLFL